MYAFWHWLKALFLTRRVKVILRNGQTVIYVRPKDKPVAEYRKEFEAWRARAEHRLKLGTEGKQMITVSSSDIIGFEIR